MANERTIRDILQFAKRVTIVRVMGLLSCRVQVAIFEKIMAPGAAIADYWQASKAAEGMQLK